MRMRKLFAVEILMKSDVRLEVTYVPIECLRPWPNNPRTHSKKQLQQIARSIAHFGFTNPVMIDADNVVIAGNGRIEAAKQAGILSVPTVRLDHLSPAQRRAYVIADNRLAEKAGWDPEILKIEFQNLALADLDFDLEITDFETAEIDVILDHIAPAAAEDPSDSIPPLASEAVTHPGDLWRLGDHKLICGDARDRELCARLFGNEQALVMFADPPYNVPIQGHVGRLGSIKHREFAMASGKMTGSEYSAFLRAVFSNAVQVTVDGAIHYVCMGWSHIPELLEASRDVYSELKNLCIWNKNNAGMGSFYRSKHELVFVYKSGTASHINTIELGKNGRYRTNVWDYPDINSFGRDRLQSLALHPTVKPVALVADAIKDCSRRKEIVFDPFVGSGTTIIAAEGAISHDRAA
jgi:DNA modification methylase